MFSEAVNHYQAGRLDAARVVCKSILAQQAEHAHALHLTGVIAMQQGDLNEAERLIRRALQASPAEVGFLNTLGSLLRRQGRMHEARVCFEQYLELVPKDAEVTCNLANLLKSEGELEQAARLYRQVLTWNPQHLNARLSLAYLLRRQGALSESEICFREGLSQGAMMPQFIFGLGLVLAGQQRHEEAEQCFRQLLCIEPMNADANFHLGNALHVRGLISEAEHHHRRCLELNPDYPEAWNNLGNDLRDQGRLDEARYAYRKALHLKPDYMRAHSNLLFSMLYDMADSQAVYEEHLQWDNMHAAGFQALYKGGSHDAGPERKIRIGYMSPDFREHSVAYFIEPILVAHDHSCFEIYCFSDVSRPDAVTARLKGYTDKWLDISTCSDEAVAETVRQEGIDILVDLAGHTSHHRLMVFARKPAPVQVTYIGYPASTGMTAMDYRLTDEWADPIGQERCHSEKLLRLPGGFLCYTPSADAPQPAPLPYAKNGHISFGCFNHLSKVTPEVVEVWSQVLQQLPGSHLVLKHISLQDAKVRERYLQMFEENGVAGDRINILDWSASVGEHLSCYSQVDIALDTFPYNGTTTTCEALWMGVPVVCLKGKTHAGRVGLSLLESAGRQEWIAGNKQEYISLALQLAADPEKLIELRARLRQALAASSLCDRSATTHALEDVYRSIWPEFCESEA
ncbi:MAG: hypothetical protein AUJ58_02930 [Zetaproteobacteria bacterium CG1_02_55_237]|nr:MAG: hypothetical protein AUJ58_02930 [Zetaproteobacteria bacterium CG1_02_55_237]